MISGIGIDICSVDRMKRAVLQKGFKERVFSEEEISYADSKANPAQHYASAFAAREAFAKATGWGIARVGMALCSIIRTDNGPSFVFSGDISEKLKENNIVKVWLSLSHENGIAAAIVVLETE
ncbi:MAG: holo-ACP synthase [Synergistaceae bacterium]|nr:holo-ACP synthase [Synergistaceae bacterium]